MNNRTMLPDLKDNAAAGYLGPVKIELLKGAGLLRFSVHDDYFTATNRIIFVFPFSFEFCNPSEV